MSRQLEACLVAARPKVIAALCRYFRDLDAAEDAFQEACVRALRSWPEKGRPRDEVGWLILVGRNAGIDEARRRQRLRPAGEGERDPPPEGSEDEELAALEHRRYGDDVLRLLFTCCHTELPPGHQIALALRLVCGLSVAEIARAFLVAPRAMEQRLTRAKRRLAESGTPLCAPTSA
ncbi:MAG: sigma-70 family RNA polymerase sigma factor, partial [Holophagales bacterium]|nr:sigma-70 family RNA polymerase sigma factor [Holophagales bacterium]